MTHMVRLIVGGQHFSVSEEMVNSGPPSRLTRIILDELPVSPNSTELVINRPANMFTAILAFYQTGRLHVPTTVCPEAFLSELEFWEISPENISPCCLVRVESFLEEQKTAASFRQSLEDTGPQLVEKHNSTLKLMRTKIWEVVDHKTPSIAGKMYFALSLLMVMFSIIVMAYSTDPSFRRPLTECERLKYIVSQELEGHELLKDYLQQLCEGKLSTQSALDILNSTDLNITLAGALTQTDEQYVYVWLLSLFKELTTEIKRPPLPEEDYLNDDYIRLEETNNSRAWSSSSPEKTLTTTTESLFLTDAEFILQNDNHTFNFSDMVWNDTSTETVNISLRNYSTKVRPSPLPSVFLIGKKAIYLQIPNFKVKIYILIVFEIMTLGFFTLDIVVRLSTCPNICRYFMSVVNIADAVALCCSYTQVIINNLDDSEEFVENWVDVLDYAQLLRTLRLFRIISNIRAGRVLAYIIRTNLCDLTVLVLFLVAGMFVFSSIFYMLEDEVESIPVGWYWAVITMTTVGYGDIHPKTGPGRLLSCLCSVSGIILLAITVPMFTGQFFILYQQAVSKNAVKNLLKNKKESRKKFSNQRNNKRDFRNGSLKNDA